MHGVSISFCFVLYCQRPWQFLWRTWEIRSYALKFQFDWFLRFWSAHRMCKYVPEIIFLSMLNFMISVILFSLAFDWLVSIVRPRFYPLKWRKKVNGIQNLEKEFADSEIRSLAIWQRTKQEHVCSSSFFLSVTVFLEISGRWSAL